MSTYAEKFNDPRWQKYRLKRMELADWKCERCETSTAQLHIHHYRYYSGRAPWEYYPNQVIVCCVACHRVLQRAKDVIADVVANPGLHGVVADAIDAIFVCDTRWWDEIEYLSNCLQYNADISRRLPWPDKTSKRDKPFPGIDWDWYAERWGERGGSQ